MLLSYLTWEEETIWLTQFSYCREISGSIRMSPPRLCEDKYFTKSHFNGQCSLSILPLVFGGSPAWNLKRNIEIFQMYICTRCPFDSLMRSICLLEIHRANLLITERVSYFSQRCLFAQNIYLYSSPGVLN